RSGGCGDSTTAGSAPTRSAEMPDTLRSAAPETSRNCRPRRLASSASPRRRVTPGPSLRDPATTPASTDFLSLGLRESCAEKIDRQLQERLLYLMDSTLTSHRSALAKRPIGCPAAIDIELSRYVSVPLI